MADQADKVDEQVEPIAHGVEIGFEPVGGGEMRLVGYYEDEVMVRGEYADVFAGNHHGRTNRGEFINRLEESLSSVEGLEEANISAQVRQWFDEMAEIAAEEELAFQPQYVQDIIQGTNYPVEVHIAEQTTWNVELTFAGRTSELQFTAAEMAGDSSGLLREKIANYHIEIVDIEPEDWEIIRDHWQDENNREVVSTVEETASDAIADRVVEKVSNAVKPVKDRDDMGNDVAAAWYDADNATVYDDAPADAPIVWVQDSFLVDQLEAAGKNLEYKGQLIKDLIARDDVYGKRKRTTWGVWDKKTKLYPFDPDALGVSEDDAAGGDDPNHSEVDL
jgi:hypothetical protein